MLLYHVDFQATRTFPLKNGYNCCNDRTKVTAFKNETNNYAFAKNALVFCRRVT